MLNGVFLMLDISRCKALKKAEGSTAVEDWDSMDMLSITDFNRGETREDSEAKCNQNDGIAVNACRMELA